MRRAPFFATLATIALVLSSCGASDPRKLGDEEYRAASGAAATVRVVADDETLRTALPDHSTVLVSAAGNLDSALQTGNVDPRALGAPLTTPKALDADPAGAAKGAALEAEKRGQAVTEEQESGWWSNLLSWGGWVTVGGIGIYLMRLLGIPGTHLLTDPMVKKLGGRWINPMLERASRAEKTAQDLGAAVESSVVGQWGLQALDRFLDDDTKQKLGKQIAKFTRGGSNSIEGLFAWLAEHHATESGHIDSVAVDGALRWIKDKMPSDPRVERLFSEVEAARGDT